MNDGTKRFGVFHLTVPREPAALRSWLSTVTNSLPVPGSEAVAWPKPTR
jgi:hypothetical protein